MSYEVVMAQTGRGGTITYLEDDGVLSFDWEFAINSADRLLRQSHS